jgi:hypothetical protein
MKLKQPNRKAIGFPLIRRQSREQVMPLQGRWQLLARLTRISERVHLSASLNYHP